MSSERPFVDRTNPGRYAGCLSRRNLIAGLTALGAGGAFAGRASPIEHVPTGDDVQKGTLVVRMFVQRTEVAAGEPLGVVLEIRNGTDGVLLLPPVASLSREPKDAGGAKRAQAAESPEPPHDPRLMELVINSEVHEGSGDMMRLRLVRLRVPDQDELAPGGTAFLALDLPAEMFAPGDCALSAKLDLKGDVVAETAPVTIRCVGRDEPKLSAE